jgi:hypothetical protein
MKRKLLSLVLLCVASTAGFAKGGVVYQAPTGSVSPSVYITMNLTPSGNAYLSPNLSSCYLGQICSFSGDTMAYNLPDGTAATLTNFSGQFAPVSGNVYQVTGQASGTDSAGHKVKVSGLDVSMTITCNRGCTKTYQGGQFKLTTK